MRALLYRLAPYSTLVLRIGLTVVLLWFGTSELIDAASWTSYAPSWAHSLGFMSAEQMVIMKGIFERVVGACLLAGFCLRWAAGLLFLHFFPILFSVGYNEIGMRDFGLHMAALSLFLSGDDRFSVDCYLRTKRWR